MPKDQQCSHCGQTFVARNTNQTYCSVACRRYKLSLHLDERQCELCGVTYTPHRRDQVTCSSMCSKTKSNRGTRLGVALGASSRGGLRGRLRQLDDILVAKGLDLEDLESSTVENLKIYQQGYKDKHGDGQVQDLMSITLSPSWEQGPQWPVIQPGPPVKLPPFKVKRSTPKGWQTAVILPDIQAGYFRLEDDRLEPIHDEGALEISLAIVTDVQPDLIVMVGDNLDLGEWGRFLTTPAYQRTTQAAVDRMTRFLAQLRIAAPGAKIVWLAGNHEERLPKYVMTNAAAAMGLRQGADPEGWPVMSVPHLCRMDDYGVTYAPGYPASTHWITKRLRVVHGDIVNSRGSTAHRYLDREKTSVIYGHIHRREWAERTRDDHDGPRTMMAASPGCLCRTDGAVPSMKGGTDLDGRPVQREEDWQQGLAVVDFREDTGWFAYDQVPIRAGWARWRGQEYAATVTPAGLAIAS